MTHRAHSHSTKVFTRSQFSLFRATLLDSSDICQVAKGGITVVEVTHFILLVPLCLVSSFLLDKEGSYMEEFFL